MGSDSKTTIGDVAEMTGVSSATVSNVIHDKQNVSEDTRRRVRAAIRAMNYRPSASAQRHLGRPAQKSIGLIVKEIHNPYFAGIVVGAQEAAAAAGCGLVVGTSEGRRETENGIVDSFVARDFDGIIINPLLGEAADLTHLFDLKRRNVPFVLLERAHGLRVDSVGVDNVTDYRCAVEHLLELGHEHIVHFAGPAYSSHRAERIEGFQKAFFEANLVYGPHLVVDAGAGLESGYRAAQQYLAEQAEDAYPTAIACYNDLVAIGAMRALRERGVSVPGRMSIIGFDNIAFCDYAPVPLTSIGVPTEEMGRRAVELLIERMQPKPAQGMQTHTLPAEMALRASTAAPADRTNPPSTAA